jgi:UDP-2,4-diacetamido-2,4,6-trideoxy-beta-L-altropyranose hydrolase
MNIAFRVDASNQIGTGHFMRCLTLADELKKEGAYIRFLCRNLPAYLSHILSSKGIEHIALEGNDHYDSVDELAHSSWLGVSQLQDSKTTINALADQVWDWIVVDHYALDARWENALRPSIKNIMAIDDLADRQHDCDVLLDQNYYADMQARYKGKVPAHCQLLLGPRYALLREEFRIFRKQAEVRTGEVKKILVFFGGVDPKNYTMQAIQALSEINANFQVDVVIGALHPFKEQIKSTCINNGYVCHVQTAHMAKLMAEADLAIGAGGTAIWERCCLGLPTITLCVAENQRQQINDAAEAGILFAPAFAKDLVGSIRLHINSLLSNPALIRIFSNSSMNIVDVKGLGRITKTLELNQGCQNKVDVRRALISDGIKVWPWRNDKATRKYFFDNSELIFDEHIKWWNKSISDSKRLLLVGILNNIEFGLVRFDFLDATKAVTSIYLNPMIVGNGLGRMLLIKGIAWLKDNYPKLKVVLAEILSENISSIKLFQSVGFYETQRSFRMEL